MRSQKRARRKLIRSFTVPSIAHLVDKNGEVHGVLELYELDPERSITGLNETAQKCSDGKYHYVLVKRGE